MTSTDDLTRAAVQAYFRLTQVLRAAREDPSRSELALTAAACEANRAMEAAGLLGRPDHEILGLVHALYPGFDGDR